jgi:hypothetical protein
VKIPNQILNKNFQGESIEKRHTNAQWNNQIFGATEVGFWGEIGGESSNGECNFFLFISKSLNESREEIPLDLKSMPIYKSTIAC